jgi:hypothetical protein
VNGISFSEQKLCEMKTDEAGRAGNQDAFHWAGATE